MSESVPGLAREVSRLLNRLRSWSTASWGVTAHAGGSRAERTTTFAHELARLGREAGSGAPDGAEPPPLAPHGLADQITVLADDLVAALGSSTQDPERRAALLTRAAQVVATARMDLEGPGFGFTALA
jgi:hypothetical protein